MTLTNTDSLEFKLGTLRAILQNAKEQLPHLIKRFGRDNQFTINHINYLHGLFEAVRVFDGPEDFDEAQAQFKELVLVAILIAEATAVGGPS